MLKVGAIILTAGVACNLVLATAILVAVILLGRNPPILYVSLQKPEIDRLDANTLATFKSLAIYFNAAVVASCLMGLFVIWMSLTHGQRWAFWALLVTMAIGQLSAFVADSFIGHQTVAVNVVFTALYLLGMILCWFGLKVA